MKQKLSFFAAAMLFGAALPQTRAQTEISVDFFYDALADQGDWIEVADYGFCWQPRDVEESWRPYTVGSWAYTDAGWTWVSEEPHGWATHHYGRWVNLEDNGWAWAPGVEWGPAWVSWRRSEEHVGWAPLPPEARFERTVGLSTWVDSYYDIGPSNYSFVEVRNLGVPNIRTVVIEPQRNITIINETRNITKITYVNNVVMNEGPDYEVVSRVSAQPIRRLTLQREVSVAGGLEAIRGGRFASRVQGDSLQVIAPVIQNTNTTNISAPKKVVKKVTNVTVNKGWRNAGTPDQVEKLRAKTRAEAPPPAQLPPQPKFEPIARRGGGGGGKAAEAATAAAPDATAPAPEPAAPGDPATAPGRNGKGRAKTGQPIAGQNKTAHPSATVDQPGGKASGLTDTDPAAPGDVRMKKGTRGSGPGANPALPGGKRGKNKPAADAPGAGDDTTARTPAAPVPDATSGSPAAPAPDAAPDAPQAPGAGEVARPRRGLNAPGNRPGRGNRPGQPAGAPGVPRGADASDAAPDAPPAGAESKPSRSPGAGPGSRLGRGNRPGQPAGAPGTPRGGADAAKPAPDASDAAPADKEGRTDRAPGAAPGNRREKRSSEAGADSAGAPTGTDSSGAPDAESGRARRAPGAGRPNRAGASDAAPGNPRRESRAAGSPDQLGRSEALGGARKAKPGEPAGEEPAAGAPAAPQ